MRHHGEDLAVHFVSVSCILHESSHETPGIQIKSFFKNCSTQRILHSPLLFKLEDFHSLIAYTFNAVL